MFDYVRMAPAQAIAASHSFGATGRSRVVALLVALALFRANPAAAHATGAIGGGFAAGALHPLTGFDHLLAMVSVGIWGAELGQPAIWLLPIGFPLVMAIGGTLGIIGVPLPATELLIALSVFALGGLVAIGRPMPLWFALGVVGVFAIAHGHAHGVELPESADALAFSVGFVVATGFLHAVGIAIGALTRWPGGFAVVRACGLLVALAGCWFLYAYAA
jgi:urease accessory protein